MTVRGDPRMDPRMRLLCAPTNSPSTAPQRALPAQADRASALEGRLSKENVTSSIWW